MRYYTRPPQRNRKYSLSLDLKNPLRSESGGSVGKLKLSSVMKEKFEAAVTGGGTSRRDSMKSSNEEEVGKLGEDRKKILEQKLRGGGGAGERSETCCSVVVLLVLLSTAVLHKDLSALFLPSFRHFLDPELHRARHAFSGKLKKWDNVENVAATAVIPDAPSRKNGGGGGGGGVGGSIPLPPPPPPIGLMPGRSKSKNDGSESSSVYSPGERH